MLRRVLALTLVLSACGEADDPSCGFEDRTYLSERSRLSGDCGELEPSLLMPGAAPSECKQLIRYSEGCVVQLARECTDGVIRFRSELTLQPSGSGYTGLADYALVDETGGGCTGLYRVTLTTQ